MQIRFSLTVLINGVLCEEDSQRSAQVIAGGAALVVSRRFSRAADRPPQHEIEVP